MSHCTAKGGWGRMCPFFQPPPGGWAVLATPKKETFRFCINYLPPLQTKKQHILD